MRILFGHQSWFQLRKKTGRFIKKPWFQFSSKNWIIKNYVGKSRDNDEIGLMLVTKVNMRNMLSNGERGYIVSKQEDNSLPYNKLEHWPPLTYRDRHQLRPRNFLTSKTFLNTENQTSGDKELQPWIPFCDGRCAFCYFPVNCDRQVYGVYLDALKKVLNQLCRNKLCEINRF